MRKLRWLEKSVQKTVEGLESAVRRLTRDWVVGVYLGGTTILSGVARALAPDRRGFEATLERLSRGMKDQHAGVLEVCRRYRQRVSRAVRRAGYDVVAIDLSEIVKPYGRKMPFLCEVRDASKSSRTKTVIEKGWWTVEIVATGDRHEVLPLWRHAYSTEAPGFKSVQHELRYALGQVAPCGLPGLRAVLDRGFDGETYFGVVEEYFGRQFAVRQRGDRQIYLTGQEEPVRMSTVAKALRKDHEALPYVVREDKLVRESVAFGFCSVEVPTKTCRRGRKKPPCRCMTLIAVQRIDPRDELPMMLLVNDRLATAAQARRWVMDYFRRWGVEDETRGAKQLGGLEDLRVLSWESIQSVVVVSVVVDGLLALLQVEAPRRAARLARLAPIDGDVPPYALYRLWLSVALLLQGRWLGG